MKRLPFVLTLALAPLLCTATTLTFEGFPDSTILTNRYPGVNFANTIVLSAGISLNEFEFPPHSGVNVASDDGGTWPFPSFDHRRLQFSRPTARHQDIFVFE